MNLTSLVAVLGVFTFGMVVVFPGSIKLRLAKLLTLDDARMGRLITVWQATSLLVMLLVGPLLDRFGHKLVLTAGFLIVSAAILLFGVARRPAIAFLASCVLGIGGSCVNAGGNALLPALHPDNPAAASNLGNTFFGLGAFVVPFAIAYLFERMSFRRALGAFAIAAAVPAIAAAAASYPPSNSGFQLSTAFGLIGNRAVLLSGFVLFCYIGLEVSMASWATTYLGNTGFSEKRASILFSLFWVAMMAGRLTASQTITTEIGRPAIQLVAAVAALAILTITLSTRAWLGAICVLALGICFAPIFPTTVGLTFAKFNPALYGSVFAIIFAMGLTGSSIVPAVIGSVSKRSSIRNAFRIMFVLAIVLFVLAFGL